MNISQSCKSCKWTPKTCHACICRIEEQDVSWIKAHCEHQSYHKPFAINRRDEDLLSREKIHIGWEHTWCFVTAFDKINKEFKKYAKHVLPCLQSRKRGNLCSLEHHSTQSGYFWSCGQSKENNPGYILGTARGLLACSGELRVLTHSCPWQMTEAGRIKIASEQTALNLENKQT